MASPHVGGAPQSSAQFDESSGPEKRIAEEEIKVFEAWKKEVDPAAAKPEGMDTAIGERGVKGGRRPSA